MRFGEAIDQVLCKGVIARREGWHDEVHIGFKMANNTSDMEGSYFYVVAPNFDEVISVPYTPDTFDMTAHDWVIYETN